MTKEQTKEFVKKKIELLKKHKIFLIKLLLIFAAVHLGQMLSLDLASNRGSYFIGLFVGGALVAALAAVRALRD